MEIKSLVIGIVAILFGLYTFVMRDKEPSQFKKYAAMKAKFGESKARVIHTLFYVAAPCIVGAVALYCSYLGISFF